MLGRAGVCSDVVVSKSLRPRDVRATTGREASTYRFLGGSAARRSSTGPGMRVLIHTRKGWPVDSV